MAVGETYEEFVEKFKPKKTTDDCYTPPGVYDVVKDWACKEYGIDPAKIVRPFYPGGDYENFNYPEGAVVLDNPPFSILSRICGFYLDRGIPFFLFAPSLTAFSGRANNMRMNHIICDCNIEYENGAIVKTSFVTSYGGDIIAQTEPRLTKLVNDEVERLRRTKTVQLPKYTYPDHIVTAALLQRYSRYGVSKFTKRTALRFMRWMRNDPQEKRFLAEAYCCLILLRLRRLRLRRLRLRGLRPQNGSCPPGNVPLWSI